MARSRWLARAAAVAALAALPALHGATVSADVGRTQSYTTASGTTVTYTLVDAAEAPLVQSAASADLNGATFTTGLADGVYELESPSGYAGTEVPSLTVENGIGTVDLAGGTWSQYALVEVCDTAGVPLAECTRISGVYYPSTGITGADAEYSIDGEAAWLWGEPAMFQTTLPDGEYALSGGESLGECAATPTNPIATVTDGVLLIDGLGLCGEQPATAWDLTLSGEGGSALLRAWVADGTKFLGTDAPDCDPDTDPSCVPEPCDPATDPSCEPEPCDPATDPSCVPEPCDPATDPECVPEPCDPATDPECLPEPCDPSTDPECLPEPCDPSTDPECVLECDPFMDPDCPPFCDPELAPTCEPFEGEFPPMGEIEDPGPMVLEGEAWFLNPDGQVVIVLRDDSRVALKLGASIDDEVASSMTLTGYPAGMRFNASTMTLSGTPYSRTTYLMTAVYTYPSGRTQTLEYFVNVAGDPQAAQVRFGTMAAPDLRRAVG